MATDSYLDHSVYLKEGFSAHDLSASILAGETYVPAASTSSASTTLVPAPSKQPLATKASGVEREAKGDISVALARLNFGIEEVTRQLRQEITTHHAQLLLQASTTTHLSTSLHQVRHGLDQVSLSLERLRLKIRLPHQTLQTHVTRLSHLQRASDVLRRTHRFILVARRLELQMQEMSEVEEEHVAEAGAAGALIGAGEEGRKERGMNKAALSIAELDSLLLLPSTTSSASEQPIPLTSINHVSRYLPVLQVSKEKLTSEMEAMVFEGLSSLNQPILASSLQTAFNLGLLPSLVRSLLSDLTDAVESRIKKTFDTSNLAREAGLKDSTSNASGYKARSARNEPTAQTTPQWTNALWARLENLIEDMASCCIKVYTLEKVLRIKKDPATQVPFLDEAMKVLDNKPSFTFWTTLAKTFETQSKEASRNSNFVQQTLSVGYPRLLRLFHQFFAKIAVHTDTVYTQNHQSPETVLILRSIISFESLYLSRSTSRLNEVVATALAGGSRSPPGSTEGITIARIMANELDSAKFDPLLLRSVARNVAATLDSFSTRMEGLYVKDSSATNLSGPGGNPSLSLNAQLTSALYHCHSTIIKVEESYNDRILSVLRPAIAETKTLYTRYSEALLTAIRREFSSIICRLHRVDFSKLTDPAAGMGGSSPYMKDLMDKMSFVRTEILAPYNVGPLKKEWTLNLVRHIVRTFVLHASIVTPLGESGKLKLTSDMTELEFSLETFLLAAGGNDRRSSVKLQEVGEDYLCLRALRPLLFLDTPSLSKSSNTSPLPPLIVLHHILVRSPLPLPHQLHNWSEPEYARWVDAHTEPETWGLIEKGVRDAKRENREGWKEVEELMKEVLKEAREGLEAEDE